MLSPTSPTLNNEGSQFKTCWRCRGGRGRDTQQKGTKRKHGKVGIIKLYEK